MPFLYRIAALLVVLAPLFAAPVNAQAPERRFALVIGNSEYKAGRLPTAANDAGLIAETLRTAGFDVAGARDLDQDTLRRSIREFLDKVSAAGPQAVTFVYLAGYGLQFEGENYIVPIDASIRRDEDIPIEAIRISDFTRPLAGTPGAVKLFIVDAARQHPFTPAGTPLASGLALVEPDPGMLIAFNAAPGSIAPVESGPYGAFAQALAEMIGTGGLGLDDLFSRLRLRVNEKTNGVAVPWYASKITQPFLFMERTPDAPPPPQVAASMELQSRPIREFSGDQEAYVAALERDTLGGYEEFVAAFADSPLASRVRALIAVRREAITWRRTVSANTPEACWSYLQRYPQGAHVADAQRRLGEARGRLRSAAGLHADGLCGRGAAAAGRGCLSQPAGHRVRRSRLPAAAADSGVLPAAAAARFPGAGAAAAADRGVLPAGASGAFLREPAVGAAPRFRAAAAADADPADHHQQHDHYQSASGGRRGGVERQLAGRGGDSGQQWSPESAADRWPVAGSDPAVGADRNRVAW